MKIEEEISGRQTVSIKPHSRLTNKLEEGPKERAQAAPAKYLDIWIQNNIEYQFVCFKAEYLRKDLLYTGDTK